MARQPAWIEIPEVGKKLPRVTTILKEMIMKQALIGWSAKMTAEYFTERLVDLMRDGLISLDELREMDVNQFVKEAKAYHIEKAERAADIGTKVHNAIEKFLKAEDGQEIEIPTDIQKPFNAFLDWWESNKVKPINIEERLYSLEGGGYTGKLDLVAELEKGVYIIDFKSSSGYYEPEMPLQLAAYRSAYDEMYKCKVDGMGVLRLDKETGIPECIFISNYEMWRIAFLHLAYSFNTIHKIKEKNKS